MSDYDGYYDDVLPVDIDSKQVISKGEIVKKAIENIPEHYACVEVDNYIVMPNHVHLILKITADKSGRPMVAPTISTVVSQMKGYVTKKVGFPIWQKLFHDHVVRNRIDYREIFEYIYNNPMQWENDCFYVKKEM